MAAVTDGGPAFPLPVAEIQGFATHAGEFGPGMTGMSLRDYFAAQALTGFISNGDIPDMLRVGFSPKQAAEACYAIADAMLQERAK
jgi:hypothetical protein